MKRILINGFIAATLSFATMAHADFTFRLNTKDGCDYLAGKWFGTGKASNWFLGECIYHGSGTISGLDNMGRFTAEVKADKDSGSGLCPEHTTKQVKGICFNGVVRIKTEYGHLDGNFSQYSGDAKGNLSVAPGMSADVEVQFIKLK
jgi:hypothetical protein